VDTRQALLDRALKELAHPDFPRLKAAGRLEKLLETAKSTGDLPMDDLRNATVDLVQEADVPRFFTKSDKNSDAPVPAGLAVIFLLLLLYILLALADEGSDARALIQELIDTMLRALRRG
jgi:hypothetical protein